MAINKLNDLLLHENTKQQLQNFLKSPSHALLVTGIEGSGKKTIAAALAYELLQLDNDKSLDSYPYFFKLQRPKNKQDIPIENVRETINKLRLKTPGKNKIRKIVFIENAQNLSIPAQNALLKVLEEPSSDTIFILTTTSEKSVLPTIASRSQHITIQPVGLIHVQKYWENQYEKELIDRAWRLSQGSVGLLFALISEENDHPLKLAVAQARQFLGQKTYERLLSADRMSRNKEEFSTFLDALNRTLHVLHHNAIKNNKPSQANRLLQSRKTVLEIYESLTLNVNARLAALRLVLSLKI